MYQNLTIQAGATFDRNIALNDANGNPLNVSGLTANGSMIRNEAGYNANTVYLFEVNLTNGNLELRMEANVTVTLANGSYVYDVKLTNGTDVYRVVEGIVDVTPAISL